MAAEKTFSTARASSRLTSRRKSSVNLICGGVFTVKCRAADGSLRWVSENPNLVTNSGLYYILYQSMSMFASVNPTYFVGLVEGPASGVTFAASDNLLTHPGWTEFTGYVTSTSAAEHPEMYFGDPTTSNPAVITSNAAAELFIDTTGLLAGVFLTTVATWTPINPNPIISEAFFDTGDRPVVSGDVVSVEYTFSLSTP